MADIVDVCEVKVILEGLYIPGIRILPTCHDYVDGSLDFIEAQSEGLKSGVFCPSPLPSEIKIFQLGHPLYGKLAKDRLP